MKSVLKDKILLSIFFVGLMLISSIHASAQDSDDSSSSPVIMEDTSTPTPTPMPEPEPIEDTSVDSSDDDASE